MILRKKFIPFLTLCIISFFVLNFSPLSGLSTVSAASGATPAGGCTLTTGLKMPKPCTGIYDCTGVNSNTCLKYNPMIQWIRFLINVLSALIGVIVIIMVTLAGIQYSSAADNPQGVQAAKKRIENVLVGLIAYIFLYAFLQWLIPGGVV
jgi:hypothetical protein